MKPRRPRAKLCKLCHKRSFTEIEAYRAALDCSASFGKPMRVYECPDNAEVFHTTSKVYPNVLLPENH